MADYTPDEDYIVKQYVDSSEEAAGEFNPEFEAEVRRGIARIKAEAWDEGNRAAFEKHCDKKSECWDETEVAGDNPYREGGDE